MSQINGATGLGGVSPANTESPQQQSDTERVGGGRPLRQVPPKRLVPSGAGDAQPAATYETAPRRDTGSGTATTRPEPPAPRGSVGVNRLAR